MNHSALIEVKTSVPFTDQKQVFPSSSAGYLSDTQPSRSLSLKTAFLSLTASILI